ncbi:hypothetical protein SSP24_03120 [Streptomyces spinoverrucosus]|uniref:Uncharacterized protein n=1 Tax=Streptomyces spinoverrucosus TaxID=284043 RepID=A0A4Y3V6R9_9ACTN|nr:hypothetical protein SSP24_03120 [Streptomyces spinoverrucosus]GHB41465.1 hypothetical protein GCM10010397_09480 [Streptomyces spinoverrucosus]
MRPPRGPEQTPADEGGRHAALEEEPHRADEAAALVEASAGQDERSVRGEGAPELAQGTVAHQVKHAP